MSFEEWKDYKLGELADITSSKRIFLSDYVATGIPFYRSKEIIQKSLGEELNDILFITEKRYYEIKDKFGAPINGDMLISAVGERAGIPFVVKDQGDFYFKDGNLIWFRRVDEKLDIDYLCYWMKSTEGKNKLESLMIGSAQKALTIVGLKGLDILLPPKRTQHRIASILSSLDAKIELNRQTNQTLEAIAQAIFKEWFVDFNFPGATGEMQDSELGEIPKGWKVGKLENIVTISSGKGLNRTEFAETGFEVLGANGRIGYTDKYLADDELILTGRVGTLGTFQLVNHKVWISDNVLAIRAANKEYYHFTYFSLRTFDFKNLNRGSTQPLITKTDLLNLILILPDDIVITKFNAVCRPLFDYIKNAEEQTKTLTQLRDNLLPKLMKGEIKL